MATKFAGNGMSRTAMVFKIATMGGVKLSPTHLNKIKNLNPRNLERVYEEVVRMGDKGNALFTLKLIIGSQLVVLERICHQSKKDPHSRCLPLSLLEAR